MVAPPVKIDQLKNQIKIFSLQPSYSMLP